MSETVTVCEVGPRDGLQMAKTIMPTAVKARWIAAIAAAGVPEIEVGSFVPPKLIPQMADTAEIVREAVRLPGVQIVALAPNLRGAQNAYEAGAHRISVPVSVSEGHSRANLNRTPAEQVAEVARVVAWVRAQPRAMQVEGACSTAFGCSIDGVVPTAAVVRVASGLAEAGVDSVGLADTVGYGHPAQIKDVVRAVRAAIGPRLEGLHLHDTMGLGLANALAGLEEGIRSFDSALAGLGGCPFAPGASGNIVTEDLVFMLESMGFSTGIDLEKLIAARAILHAGLPAEPMHGNVPKAGIPRTYHPAGRAAA
ncbi:hydroxymethylglutaryl-CoA lyase [Limobrevibacterium gyesilva]|uniref:Hydroxymethylglutaryl-CoA lyase n=1 Tax=Limobrevibacterium gyesilva TaxID=2991712 RepID=A0AA42CCB5_9PROT|nr:hydroxymethylglutaryl-CoA lyase [Limobrevibacterium gyesilva]MCW3473043.1 hydroxymethylglutaryl-CoA lyase [Limobrevibacterium gyesilva]